MQRASSLRTRLILLLGAIALPVAMLSFFWIAREDATLRELNLASAVHSAEIVAENLAGVDNIPAPLLSGLVTAGDLSSAERCSRLAKEIVDRSSTDYAVAFYQNRQLFCSAQRPGTSNTPPPQISWSDYGSSETSPYVLGVLDTPGKVLSGATRVVVGTPPVEWIGVVFLGQQTVDSVLASGLSQEIMGVALQGMGGKILVERHDARTESDWTPNPPVNPGNSPTPTVLRVKSGQGDKGEYVAQNLATIGTKILVVYDPKFTIDGRRRMAFYRMFEVAAMVLLTLAAAVWASDRAFLRWIVALRNLAMLHSVERSDGRFGSGTAAPLECARLGVALDRMADTAARQIANLQTVGTEKLKLLEELHHRVGNNFQVIDSLLSLQKKTLPVADREDLRLLEEHLRAIATAHRLSFSVEAELKVSLESLITEIVIGLRLSAELGGGAVELSLSLPEAPPSVDYSILLGLFLAAFIPPFLTTTKVTNVPLKIDGNVNDYAIILKFSGPLPTPDPPPFLRERLATAYLTQLGGQLRTIGPLDSNLTIIIPLPGEGAS